ncbi:CG8546 [Drosophila busckii]|uniref:CG8546 n=1 Tax=Drosophila busckii TaxID=30019 RepID=A0A0M3QW07_DROBS|nr:pickpocket protein 28 [Drosophila busckii]ALC43319.1 CG8546 [Drosophila busckii]
MSGQSTQPATPITGLEVPKQAQLNLATSHQWKRAALMAKTASACRDTNSDDSEEEVDTKQQIKYGSGFQAAMAIIHEYCDYSTIHGIRYLGEKKRPWLERLFWVSVFLLSICTCFKLTMNIWDKWNNNPVIVSFAEKSTPVWQIPFPSVTVCPETKSRQRAFNFTDIYWQFRDFQNNVSGISELTDKQKSIYGTVSQVCDAHLYDIPVGNKVRKGIEIIDELSDVSPMFDETYLDCKWRNAPINCKEIFHKFVTEDGVCYSFNSLSPAEIFRAEGIIPDFIFREENRLATEWNVEDGYSISANTETYPNRVLGPGAKAGLYLFLGGLEVDFDDMCRGPVQGFKILLHTPGEVAQVTRQYFRIPFDQEVLISIRPKIITTSDGLKYYEPQRRQCFFQKERNLRYFNIYSQSNCELECLANYTLTKCGCVKFSMPRNVNMPVCGADSLKCYNEAEDKLLLQEFQQGQSTEKINARGKTDCNCLPSCTSIAYEAEISQADFDYKTVASKDSVEAKREGMKMSRVSIFFKEAQFLTSRRSELYGTTDFLANCGGLLGLFMGVSTLSIVELVYFCTVRLISNLRMRRKTRKELHLAASKEA